MKKTFLIITAIFILGFLGSWGIKMYQFAEGVNQDANIMQELKEQQSNSKSIIHEESINPKDLQEIILTETNLGTTYLNDLDSTNINHILKSAFPAFEIKANIGEQDGPDFMFYQVEYKNQEIFFVSMHANNPKLVQDIYTNSPIIRDQYGLFVGSTTDSILAKRPEINFHSDLHDNIYASAKNSKIQYRLKGDFKSQKDSSSGSDDFKIDKWQVEAMNVAYIIWKK